MGAASSSATPTTSRNSGSRWRRARADPRVGHFETQIWDFSSDAKFTAKTHYVNRWRLEEERTRRPRCRSPRSRSCSGSTATFPDKYRGVVREGILEWNKAFERIGFKDAIVVKQQEADADLRHLRRAPLHRTLVRFHRCRIRDRSIDHGPAHRRNPRTPKSAFRNSGRGTTACSSPNRRHRHGPRSTPTRPRWASMASSCTFATDALAGVAVRSRCSRGARRTSSPEVPGADAFVAACARRRSSCTKSATRSDCATTSAARPYTRSRKISDPKFSTEVGITGSIMDYNPLNIAVKGEIAGRLRRTVDRSLRLLGNRICLPPVGEGDRERRAGQNRRQGATDPLLAFSSDEEVIAGLDPDASQFDLGSDPLST